MEGNFIERWLTFSWGPSPYAILLATLVALALPFLLHTYLYRTQAAATLPTFLLIGPSGVGKTSLLTLLENGTPSLTHTSQVPLSTTVALPADVVAASDQYRSVNDPTRGKKKQFRVLDTPGHGKLRHLASSQFLNPQSLKGIVFMVDAANISVSSDQDAPLGGVTLTATAEYLHDVLLTLQKRQTNIKSSKRAAAMSVLVAANKSDLFTALPAKLVKKELETEITKLRQTRSRGLLDSGVGMDDVGADDERDILGGAGEGSFVFSLMEEYGISIEVAGGSVRGTEGADIGAWWRWFADHL